MGKVAQLHECPEFARSIGTVYVAEGLAPVTGGKGAVHNKDLGEATMEVLRLSDQELRRMVRIGQIRSTTVIAAFHHFIDYRERSRLSSSSHIRSDRLSSFLCPFTGVFEKCVSSPAAAASAMVMAACAVAALR